MKTLQLIALFGILGACGLAQAATKCRASKALQAKAKAKVSCEQAQKAALEKVPDSKVRSAELEEEKGKLIYSFDLAVKGKSGIEEVQVDAATGDILSVEHESAAHEAEETKQEKSAKPPRAEKK